MQGSNVFLFQLARQKPSPSGDSQGAGIPGRRRAWARGCRRAVPGGGGRRFVQLRAHPRPPGPPGAPSLSWLAGSSGCRSSHCVIWCARASSRPLALPAASTSSKRGGVADSEAHNGPSNRPAARVARIADSLSVHLAFSSVSHHAEPPRGQSSRDLPHTTLCYPH